MTVKRSKPDQFLLRLPPGLRDRIKSYADSKGRSVNEQIVRILERDFPEPWSIVRRLIDTAELAKILREGVSDERVDRLRADIHETLRGIASGQVIDMDEDVREHIRERLRTWEARQDRSLDDLDQEELDSLIKRGHSKKFEQP